MLMLMVIDEYLKVATITDPIIVFDDLVASAISNHAF